jgi:hypothetical protein
MNENLKKQLVKLGSTNPELRPHIREVLGSLEGTVSNFENRHASSVDGWINALGDAVQAAGANFVEKVLAPSVIREAKRRGWDGEMGQVRKSPNVATIAMTIVAYADHSPAGQPREHHFSYSGKFDIKFSVSARDPMEMPRCGISVKYGNKVVDSFDLVDHNNIEKAMLDEILKYLRKIK